MNGTELALHWFNGFFVNHNMTHHDPSSHPVRISDVCLILQGDDIIHYCKYDSMDRDKPIKVKFSRLSYVIYTLESPVVFPCFCFFWFKAMSVGKSITVSMYVQ